MNENKTPGHSLATPLFAVAMACGTLLAAPPAGAAVLTTRTVALSGDSAPGAGPGVNYSGFRLPVLNGAGQTAFLAPLAGPGVNSFNDFGIWSEGAGSIGSPGLVAREGDAAPGAGPGVIYNGFSSPVFNGAGQTALRASLIGVGVNSSNDFGIWSEGAGSIGSPGLVARSGDAASGTGPGVVYGGFGVPVLNGAGRTAFSATLTGTGVTASNDSGIWSEGAGAIGSPGLVARSGDAAPGAGPGANYVDFSFPVLNGAGETAFVASLIGPGVNSFNDLGIWSEGAGSIGSPGLVARSGDAAPGTGPGVNYGAIFGAPVLNGAGETAFTAVLTGQGVNGSNDIGIWSEGAGSIGSPGLVARSGDAAPGAGPGANYRDFSSPVLNGAGQTAFSAFLTGPGVTVSNDSGIWATDPDGLLTLIAREGDLYDVNDDPIAEEFRTITGLGLFTNSGGEDGRRTSFNDAGQLAFLANFSDGSSGIFVTTISRPIPEPAAWGLALGALVWSVGRARP